MAIAYVNSTGYESAAAPNTSTLSFNVGTGDNRVLVVGLGLEGTTSDLYTGVTYNGVAMTLVGKIFRTGQYWSYTYILVNPDSGTHDIVSTKTTGGSWMEMVAICYTGCNQSSQPDAHSEVITGTTTTPTDTLNSTVDNCWKILFTSSNTTTISSGGIYRTNSDTYHMFDTNASITPAGAYDMVLSAGNETHSLLSLTLAPVVTSAIKSFNGLAKASIKSVNGLAIANVKSFNGLA